MLVFIEYDSIYIAPNGLALSPALAGHTKRATTT